MRVLVACEFSGVVRDAFAALGHDAWSCDLLPSERPGNHIQGDCLAVLDQGWDLMIAHPPCTRLCNSGVLRLYKPGTMERDPVKWQEMERGAALFRALWDAPVQRIAIENPVMHGHALRLTGARHTQTIQPYQFGHPESKRTCLWLKSLPVLVPKNILQKPECGYWQNQTPSGQNRLGPSPTRGQDRARTYAGIAQAMADQWS